MLSLIVAVLAFAISGCKPDRPTITLTTAAQRGDLDQIKRHLYWGCDVNSGALDASAAAGKLDAYQMLREHGAQATKDTAEAGASSGNAELADLVLTEFSISSKQPEVELALFKGHLLCLAVKKGEPSVVAAILRHGPNLSGSLEDMYRGETPLNIAVKADNVECTRLLLKAGVSPNEKPPRTYCQTIMDLAVCTADVALVQLLLDAGGDPNAYDPDCSLSQRPLERATNPYGDHTPEEKEKLSKIAALLRSKGAF